MADTDSKYLTVTKDNFQKEVLESGKPALVDFWAEWCPPCRMTSPIVDELAGEYEGRAVVGKVNVDDQQELAATFGVSSIPAFLFFLDGEVKDMVVGGVPKEVLQEKLDKLGASAA